MSGHNKWSKVKRVKGPLDAKRGKLFTKLIKEITISAKIGGGNPDGNPRLRQAIQSAKDASMPKDNIERAIKKGTGELAGEAIEEVLYEGYGPHGIAVLVETTTDNRNRTVSDLRNLFRSANGNMGESGSVSWMFTRYGFLSFDKTKYPSDKIMEVALESGVEDFQDEEETVEVYTEIPQLYKIKEAFERVGMHPIKAHFTYMPKTSVLLEKSEEIKNILQFFEELEDHDDVQTVHSNLEIDPKFIPN